ncbi:MAG: hypothetical protein WHS64_03110 [Fervidobacterium sp.]|uniref:hypothetical protein n=1 Tax=Fervidobacterium TaxID=2422 RepID=UPI0030A15E38
MFLEDLYIRAMKSESVKSLLRQLCNLIGVDDRTLDSADGKNVYDVAREISSKGESFFKHFLNDFNTYTFLFTLLDMSIPTLGKKLGSITTSDVNLFMQYTHYQRTGA